MSLFGDWRVIYHLSAPFGHSINDHIEFTMRYSTVDDAISICQKLGCGTLLAKIDLKNVFRQCPVRKNSFTATSASPLACFQHPTYLT